MAFNLDDYEPVASRVQRFYEAYPKGAIHCDIVFDDGSRVIIKATVYRDVTDPIPAAIDFAEEHLTDRGVNATSRVENACTSAIGRAVSVAAHGLGPSDYTKKPTREEMSKVQRMEQGTDKRMPSVTVSQPSSKPFDGVKTIPNKFKAKCSLCGVMMEAGSGLATNSGSGWVNTHKEGQCNPEEPF